MIFETSPGFVSMVLGNNAAVYYLPATFDRLNEFYAEEARKLGIHSLDVRQLLDRVEFKDHWHMWNSGSNKAMVPLYLAREIQILLMEARASRFYCSLKRLAERFAFDEAEHFASYDHGDLVDKAHNDQADGLSAARHMIRARGMPAEITREDANKALPELNAIEALCASRLPSPEEVAKLPDDLHRAVTQTGSQGSSQTGQTQSVGGDPVPGREQVVTSTLCG